MKNRFSLTEPCGPPSALAPLSLTTMISVFVELPDLLEEGDQPADVVVGVLEEAGEDLHHARVEPLLVGAERCPTPRRRDRARRAACPAAEPELLSGCSNTFSR